MAKRSLVSYVHVGGKVYGPGDEIPAEVARKITNPKVWKVEDSEPDSPDPEAEKAAAEKAEAEKAAASKQQPQGNK